MLKQAATVRAPSSLCKLEGEVPRCDASSVRYHHFSGSSNVAARICWRIAGKSASRTRDLRITRKYLRGSRKTSILVSKMGFWRFLAKHLFGFNIELVHLSMLTG